tara:strand:- start:331 stop:480 length:150 start_codon:yes stop_codon:yes gene_type:complete
MILSITILFGALGYFFYTLKKELAPHDDTPLENFKKDDDLYKNLEDLFI